MNFAATKVTFYAVLYQQLRDEAYKHGYALALHGSLQKDLDVIAIPWVENAAPAETLVKALVERAGGMVTVGCIYDGKNWVESPDPACKPHGRMVWTIHLGGHEGGYVDLGVMPLRPSASLTTGSGVIRPQENGTEKEIQSGGPR